MDEYETKEVFTDKEYLYDVATWIDGHSMEPVYQNGEIALIREGGFDYDGAVYAISWNEKLYIKKVYLEKDGYRLVSINDSYPDKFVPAEDEPRIVGKIVGNFIRNRPITRYLSNHSFLQYTVIKNKLEDFLCHNPSSH